MRIKVTLLLVILVSTVVLAQNPSKGFELLESKKYDEAEMSFHRSAQKIKDLVPSFYGLGLVLSNQNNSHQNLDTAYYFTTHAELLYNGLEKSDRDKLFKNYQLSIAKIQALRYAISVDAYKRVDATNMYDLKKYVFKYKNEKPAQRAREIITEYEAFKDYNDSKPIEYYDNLVQKYPKNPLTAKAWKKLYDYYTADGEFLSIEQFEMYYPTFPFDSLAVAEKEFYRFAKTNRCFDFVIDANRQKCRDYISKLAPKHSAFLVFQNIVKSAIDNKQWNKQFIIKYHDMVNYNLNMLL